MWRGKTRTLAVFTYAPGPDAGFAINHLDVTMVTERDLAIRWFRPRSVRGELDVFPAGAFAKVGHPQAFTHYYFQSAKRYPAKCRLTVHERHADLDYSVFPDFNKPWDNDLGVLRLRFSNRRRDALSAFEWKPASTDTFTPGWGTVAAEEADSAAFISNLRTRSKTQKQALQLARLGQGDFRRELISYWNGCAVTNCTRLEALRASHIKPWSEATNRQRLDPFNGLLLIGTLDALFDTGLITFSNTGQLLRSPRLSHRDCKDLGLRVGMRLRRVHAKHKTYLAWHRRKVFSRNGG
jgi:hypothetical protein